MGRLVHAQDVGVRREAPGCTATQQLSSLRGAPLCSASLCLGYLALQPGLKPAPSVLKTHGANKVPMQQQSPTRNQGRPYLGLTKSNSSHQSNNIHHNPTHGVHDAQQRSKT